MKILIVCLGNICRSPAGEAILRHLTNGRVEVDSCGLGDWHAGHAPDLRMRKAAQERGYLLNGKAKSFKPEFLAYFDLILAVDRSVLSKLQSRVGKTPKLRLMSDFSTNYPGQDIPDPYHGTIDDFHKALDMLEDACRGCTSGLS